jgi:CBS domain-containing protein
MKVHEVMTSAVVTARPDATLKEAALLLAEHGISGLPVVNDEGAVVGVVSEADILAKETAAENERHGVAHWLLDARDPWRETRFAARTVEEAMSSPVRTIDPDRPVVEAATRMLEEGINRLPVVDPHGKLVGLVSRGDLVRAFVRSDEAIRREIEEDLLRGTLRIDHPDDVRVEVADGEVTLSGTVDSPADTELVPRHVRRVPGVVGVTSTLALRNEEEPAR